MVWQKSYILGECPYYPADYAPSLKGFTALPNIATLGAIPPIKLSQKGHSCHSNHKRNVAYPKISTFHCQPLG
jgi:hypothetical protein